MEKEMRVNVCDGREPRREDLKGITSRIFESSCRLVDVAESIDKELYGANGDSGCQEQQINCMEDALLVAAANLEEALKRMDAIRERIG